jgi:prevent-host-death family protein
MPVDDPLYNDVQRRTVERVSVMTASEARARLPEILDRVGRGEEVTITRHDQPVAVVIAPGALRLRRASAEALIVRAEELGRRLDAARDRTDGLSGAITEEYAEELIRQIRSDRDSE